MDEEFAYEASNIADMIKLNENGDDIFYSYIELDNSIITKNGFELLGEAFKEIYEDDEIEIIETTDEFLRIKIKKIEYNIENDDEFYKITKIH